MMTAMEVPIPAEQLLIVPANKASWDDLAAIFGTTDYAGQCQCQRFKVLGWIWRDSTQGERTEMLRSQTACGNPNAAATSGLVAYVDHEPAGWVAVEPRTAYPKLRTSRVAWTGRNEDKSDDGIWAVTCFVVRKGYRGRGLTYPLARATIDFARERGARALEAYPMMTQPGKEITWGEVHVGARQVFEDAGFEEVSRPTVRRVGHAVPEDRRTGVSPLRSSALMTRGRRPRANRKAGAGCRPGSEQLLLAAVGCPRSPPAKQRPLPDRRLA
jgi:GNAT superfamily N-acetyltransferase